MTTATLPTKIGLSLGNGTSRLWCDSLTNIKYLVRNKPIPSATTNYHTLQANNADYTVPASTNFRIFGFETFLVSAKNTGNPTTLCQVGYADDNAGTNFVSLVDLLGFMNAIELLATGSTLSGFSVGMVTVPTGKLPIIKQTTAAAAVGSIVFQVIGIETV